MKKIISLALVAASLVAAPAMAQSVGVVGGAVAGNLNQSSANGSFSFNGAGNGSAESGSGFNATLQGSNGGAAFGSIGTANSLATVTPFTSESTSSHAAFAGGYATPGASFNASQVMSFGQGSAENAFNTSTTVNFDQSALSFQAAGFIGWAGF